MFNESAGLCGMAPTLGLGPKSHGDELPQGSSALSSVEFARPAMQLSGIKLAVPDSTGKQPREEAIMSLADIKVGTRLGTGFGLMLVLIILLVVMGLSRMAKVQHALDDITQDNMVKMTQLYAMRGDLNNVAISVRNIALTPDEQGIAEEAANIDNARSDYDEHARILYSMLDNESEKAAIRENRGDAYPHPAAVRPGHRADQGQQKTGSDPGSAA